MKQKPTLEEMRAKTRDEFLAQSVGAQWLMRLIKADLERAIKGDLEFARRVRDNSL